MLHERIDRRTGEAPDRYEGGLGPKERRTRLMSTAHGRVESNSLDSAVYYWHTRHEM